MGRTITMLIDHQKIQVPKMEESWTLQGYFGGGFPLT